jgi:hypothetical protein
MNTLSKNLAQVTTTAALCLVLGTGLALAAGAAGSAAGFAPGVPAAGGPRNPGLPSSTTAPTRDDQISPDRASSLARDPDDGRAASPQTDGGDSSVPGDALQQERQQGGRDMVRERTGQAQ